MPKFEEQVADDGQTDDVTDIEMVCDAIYRQSRSLSLPNNTLDHTTESLSGEILSKKDVSLGRLLGSGGFGSVYLGTYKNKEVAVKIFHAVSKNPQAQVQSFKAELAILNFKHPHIIRTITATTLEDFNDGPWVVMEYVSDKTLQSVINDMDQQLCMVRRLKYALQIASAVQYAHDNCIVHLDIKPVNVLLTQDDDCKLGDFGCCQEVEFNTGRVSPTNRSALTGTFAYRAPELLKGGAPSLQADIYSYGVTLWQMLSRETPYANENQHVVIFGVVAYGLRPKNPVIGDEPFDKLYQDLYTQCWVAEPDDRPTSTELMEILETWKQYID
ncbi:serine/threonine-protein kinase mos-like [Haliotis asinina]|uniref:serine/threonine-protein kinase mos-like n=1 Tax=Haliotis asinina TaxID=109174 RepID=UPI00353267DB